MKTISNVVKARLCVSCGACCYISSGDSVKMNFSKRHFMDIPFVMKEEQKSFDVCPGKGYDIFELGNENSNGIKDYDIDLGFVDEKWAIHSNNPTILENASSGGIMTTIASYLLENNLVNGIVATKFEYGLKGPRPVGIIATTLDELIACQGSKYTTVNHERVLLQAKSFRGTLAYIGTPCQIAALRMIQGVDDHLKQKIRYTLGNFCGGIKDNRELLMQIKRHGFTPESITQFRYRGGGQPGSMLLRDNKGKVATHCYPDYNYVTGYKKLKRCRLCVDATAELADFACGDAWLDKYRNSVLPWSIILTRNKEASGIVSTMIMQKLVTASHITIEEIKLSQKSNLQSKKYRTHSRIALYKLLRIETPVIESGFHKTNSNIKFELKVLLSHTISEGFESMKIFFLLELKRKLLRNIRFKIKRVLLIDKILLLYRSLVK